MIHYSEPPVLLRDVIEDGDAVDALLARNAPYTPLGGWYRPGVDPDTPTSPMWFQNDWVHADLRVEGSELFLFHERVTQAARDFYKAEIIVPHSVYVNVMAALERSGPAHTDNPRFQGRDRSNTPMWLLRTMLWSGLFDEHVIVQATSIWWRSDVEGGGLLYWPDGPDAPPREHVGAMANTALVGDNHGMFHQVGPVGPFDQGTRLVTPRAELAPSADHPGEWAVVDRGDVQYQAPLDSFRVSVLWKADVYANEEERQRQTATSLTLEQVAETFNADLHTKGIQTRLDPENLEDPAVIPAVSGAYPEAVPVGRKPSIFDA